MEPQPRTRSKVRPALALAVLALAAVALAGCAPAGANAPVGGTISEAPVELVVSAASSLRSVLTSTAPEFERSNGVKLSFNFGASGQLAKQIEAGAPADVFLSASPAAVATLAAEGLVSAEASATFAGNTLIVLVPAGNPASVHGPGDLAKAGKLTTGDPTVAPHGQKAMEWLTGLGLWDALLPKFVFAANAAQTDDYVARGEVDAGIGFGSDAHGRPDLEVAYTVPDDEITPIAYVGAPVTATGQAELAKAYLDHLMSPGAQAALMDAGFRPAPAK